MQDVDGSGELDKTVAMARQVSLGPASGAAAAAAPRFEPASLHASSRHNCFRGQSTELEADAPPAAVPAVTARSRQELVPLDEDRRMFFNALDGRVA